MDKNYLIKIILAGLLVGLIIGILGIIPFCSCFLGPFICLLGGFLLGKIVKIGSEDYGTLTINLIIYSFSGALIGTVIGYFVNVFYGTTIAVNPFLSITTMFSDVIFPFLYVGGMLFVFGAIGGLIYMFTKK